MPFSRYANTFSGNWSKIIDKYGELNGHYLDYASDAAYWYSEMTNTGLLATAAWMCDAPAISEVREEKRVYNGNRGRPGPSTGRVDLFLYPDDEKGHWVETKCLVRPVDMSEGKRERRVIRGLSGKMKDARQSAKQCRSVAQVENGLVVALTFVPFVLSSNYYGQGRRRVAREQRAREASGLLADFAKENGFSHAAYFKAEHIDIWDENEMRPFGFGIIAHFDR